MVNIPKTTFPFWLLLAAFLLPACLVAEPSVFTAEPASANYYQRLGVPENASHDRVVEAYQAARLQFLGSPEAQTQIEEAYEVLGNPVNRQGYDLIKTALSSRPIDETAKPGENVIEFLYRTVGKTGRLTAGTPEVDEYFDQLETKTTQFLRKPPKANELERFRLLTESEFIRSKYAGKQVAERFADYRASVAVNLEKIARLPPPPPSLIARMGSFCWSAFRALVLRK